MKHRIDIPARLYMLIASFKRQFLHSFFTFIKTIDAYSQGVELGRGCSFNGSLSFNRFKHSTIKIGNNCIFNSSSIFNPRGVRTCILHTATDFAKIEIGDNCGFSGVSIVAWQSVMIGNNVMVGADTCIGDTDDHPERLGTASSPIEIQDNVFIGMRCLILKGVTIGENSIIGAGSVVTKDIPANCVAAGVPCKVIRFLDK